jgi:hypothetical protein
MTEKMSVPSKYVYPVGSKATHLHISLHTCSNSVPGDKLTEQRRLRVSLPVLSAQRTKGEHRLQV